MNTHNEPPSAGAPGETPAYVALASPALVAIDRDKALIFRCLAPGTEPVMVLTTTSGGNALHGQLDKHNIPPGPAYFEAIAQALGEPGAIQITGCGADAIPMVNALLAWLETCHPLLAARIITTSLNSDRFCTNNRLLTNARNYLANQAYALPPVPGDPVPGATRIPFEPKTMKA